CQLDRVGGAQRAITPERRVHPCCLGIEGKQQGGSGDGIFVLPCQFFVSLLDGFDENLAECQRGRQELVTPCEHRLPQAYALFRRVTIPAEEVDKQGGVPKHPAHSFIDLRAYSQPPRGLSTYSSACSSAHKRFPEPARESGGSVPSADLREAELQSR